MKPLPRHLPIVLLAACALLAVQTAHAGLLDKIKKSVEKKIEDHPAAAPAAEASAPAAQSQETGLKAYANYDFVPGDTVLFEDDFTADQDGEFPAHWDLDAGQAVVNKVQGVPAFRLTEGNYAVVKPLIKGDHYLGDAFTVEFDFFDSGGEDPIVFLKVGDDRKNVAFGHEVSTGYFPKDFSSDVPVDADQFRNAWHHAALAWRDGQMKCYVDQYRVLVVPHCGFSPEALSFGGIGSQDQPITFRNVRVAAGGGMNMLDHILTDGRLVTHAITFDVNRAVIRPQSMGFLNQMSGFLEKNPAVKMEIDGYTDSDGDAAANLTLSQERAGAVKAELVALGVDASRLTTKGFGASRPIASNDTLEGKAANRRVEFVKL